MWLLAVKVILHKGGLKFLYTSKGRKFETAMAHKNKNRNIQAMQHTRMCYAYCFGLNPGMKKMPYQLAINKTFCPIPQLLTHQRL